jgi:hypothetical protein
MYACSCWEQRRKLLIPLTRLSEFPNLEAAAYSEWIITSTVMNVQPSSDTQLCEHMQTTSLLIRVDRSFNTFYQLSTFNFCALDAFIDRVIPLASI